MGALLIRDAELVVTMDDECREVSGCDVLVEENVITHVGPSLRGVPDGAEVLDARGCLVIPGLINTHNHVWGTLYRAVPAVQTASWEQVAAAFTTMWRKVPFTPDALYDAALANFGKHLLTGCTTTADHHWVYQRGVPRDFVDREIDAARQIGMRFHAGRGCLSLPEAEGGLPDDFVEPEDEILAHAEQLIQKYHDTQPYAMTRVVLSPSAIYGDSERLYREMRVLASQYDGVHLHTHVHQGDSDRMAVTKYGVSPVEFMDRTGWLGEDVVFYHFDTQRPEDIKRVAMTNTFVSICTAIDIRMGYASPSGALPPVRELLDASGNVCFGTSNPFADNGNSIIDDMRVCLLAERLRFDDRERWITARDVLRMATRDGARALGREDIGSIAPGNAADLALFNLDSIDMAGCHDPVAFLTGSRAYTKATIVNGRIVARDGHLLTVAEDDVIRNARQWAKNLAAAE